MKNPEHPMETLSEIRSLMERSTKFLSLSGLSGIAAGLIALAGVLTGAAYLGISPWGTDLYTLLKSGGPALEPVRWLMVGDAILMMSLSVGFSTYFCYRKACRAGVKLLDRSGYRLAYNLGLPLLAGGLFCMIMLFGEYPELVPSLSLIFYGMALLNASKYTLGEIRVLGLGEIGLGLIAGFSPAHGLLFWTLGFSLFHIFYGAWMYQRYDYQHA